MRHSRILACKGPAIAGGLLLLSVAPASAQSASTKADAAQAAQSLSLRIDDHLARRWTETKVRPAPPADDGEFLRRVYLDLAGRIPSVSEARAFLDDKNPGKRGRLLEELLASPDYVRHHTAIWMALLLPPTEGSPTAVFGHVQSFEAWVSESLAQNKPYDRMVRELIAGTATISVDEHRPYAEALQRWKPLVKPSPRTFYLAKLAKPENLAASTARLFLGVRLECAQCHDHPFAKWKRDDFWQYAAFFSGLKRDDYGADYVAPISDAPLARELTIPGNGRVVQARFPDGSVPRWDGKSATRKVLAEWMTAAKNPYFARAAVNRLWAHYFGVGLVDPVDDFGDDNPASHPELLDELASQFAAHGFDQQFLMRAILATRAYQATGRLGHPGQSDQRLFARMATKGLSSYQVWASLRQATGWTKDSPWTRRAAIEILRSTQIHEVFRPRGPVPDRPTECLTTIPQALTLMNDSFIADATSMREGSLLKQVLDDSSLDTAQRIETLYLAALSRRPRPEEAARMAKYVKAGANMQAALADVFWALLNSTEFNVNH
jgi:hypothetical protein